MKALECWTSYIYLLPVLIVKIDVAIFMRFRIVRKNVIESC